MKKPHEENRQGIVQRYGPDALLLATVTCAGIAIYLFAGPAWTWLYGAMVLGIGSYATAHRDQG